MGGLNGSAWKYSHFLLPKTSLGKYQKLRSASLVRGIATQNDMPHSHTSSINPKPYDVRKAWEVAFVRIPGRK